MAPKSCTPGEPMVGEAFTLRYIPAREDLDHVGVFADPAFPAPTISVYEERRHAWVATPEGAEHYD